MSDRPAPFARLDVPESALEISAYRSGAHLVIALNQVKPQARGIGRIVLEQFYQVDHTRVLLGEWTLYPGPEQ